MALVTLKSDKTEFLLFYYEKIVLVNFSVHYIFADKPCGGLTRLFFM